MDDLMSYSISDFLMYSPDTYYGLFALYNRALWPAPLWALLVAAFMLHQLLKPGRFGGRPIVGLTVLAWLLTGSAYFHLHFASINWAADWFGGAFIVQAALCALLWRQPVVGFVPLRHLTGRFGVGLFAVSAFMVPLSPLLEHRAVTEVELFGLAPDPTVIGTFGLLLCFERAPWLLFIVPALWATIGGAFLYAMLSPLWWLMPVSAMVAIVLRGRERQWRF